MSRTRNEAAVVTTSRVEPGVDGRSCPEGEQVELVDILGRLTMRERASLRRRLIKLWHGVDRSSPPRRAAKALSAVEEG
jgi:hypothetical protein